MMTPVEKLVLEGGKVKVLTQGRQLDNAEQSGVIVDYLRFTIKRDSIPASRCVPPGTDDQNLAKLFALQFANLLGYTLGQDRPGRDYYEFTTTIENALGQEVASVSAGGEGQRETIAFTLKGEGCTHAHRGWEKRVYSIFQEYKPKITRIDLARDFYDGEVSIEEVVGHYLDHSFSYQNRYPSYTQHGCWLGTPQDGSDMRYLVGPAPSFIGPCAAVEGRGRSLISTGGHSRTFQIGKRESGKLFRAYEKGHQFKMMDSPWLRCEVELRSVNRVIPWEALLQTGEFFAGAYEFCTWAAQHEIVTRIMTATKVAEACVERAMRNFIRTYGPTISIVTAALPTFDWAEQIALSEVHRPVPRGLRGLSHSTIVQGLEKCFGKPSIETNASVPAAVRA